VKVWPEKHFPEFSTVLEVNQRNSMLKTEGQVPSWQLLLDLYTSIYPSSIYKMKSSICHSKTFPWKITACLCKAQKRFLSIHVDSTCSYTDVLRSPFLLRWQCDPFTEATCSWWQTISISGKNAFNGKYRTYPKPLEKSKQLHERCFWVPWTSAWT